MLIVTLLCSTQSDVVDADQLVLRAAMAERAHHATAGDRVGFRFSPSGVASPFSIVQEIGIAGGGAAHAAPGAVPPVLARTLEAAGFDWRQPLSTQPLVAFRASHPVGRTERVITLAREGLLVLTTAVAAGELSEIELTANAETYQVVRQAFVFRDLGRFEIEELTHRAPAYIPPHRPAFTSIPRHPSRDELDLAELKARLVLGETGIDMRGEVRISRTPDVVRVESGLLSADRRPGVSARLAAIKYVELGRHDGDLSRTDASQVVPNAARFGLRRWRDRTFSGSALWASFLPDLTRSLATVRQRLAILAELAERYPAPQGQVSPAVHAAFRQLVDLHYQRLRAELNESRELVSAFSGTVPVVYDAASTPPHLIAHAPAALSRASALQQAVQSSFRHDDLTPADRERVSTAFDALWQAVYGSLPPRD